MPSRQLPHGPTLRHPARHSTGSHPPIEPAKVDALINRELGFNRSIGSLFDQTQHQLGKPIPRIQPIDPTPDMVTLTKTHTHSHKR